METLKRLLPKLSLQRAWELFLAVVFPIHFWAILIFILDAPTPESANEWGEFFAIASYILIIAFIESVVIWIGLLVLSYLLPGRWAEETRFGVLIVILYLLAVAGALAQVGLVFDSPGTPLFQYISINLNNTRLYRQIAFAAGDVLVVLASIALLVWGIWGRLHQWLFGIAQQAMLLSYLYLLLDLVGLAYAVSRNL